MTTDMPISPDLKPRYVEFAGQSLEVIEGGTDRGGVPVVFIHGIVCAAGVWLPTLPPAIRDGRHWIALGLPGHAAARLDIARLGGWDKLTPEVWASLIEQALQQLVGHRPVSFVGWSTGGFSALAMALFFPARVHSLLVISGFTNGHWRGTIGFSQRLALARITQPMLVHFFRTLRKHRDYFEVMMHDGLHNPLLPNPPAWDASIDACFAAWQQFDPAIIAGLFRQIYTYQLTDRLAQIRCPTLVIGGESDPYIPGPATARLAARIPGAELKLFSEVGHYVMLEQTAAYQELVTNWVSR